MVSGVLNQRFTLLVTSLLLPFPSLLVQAQGIPLAISPGPIPGTGILIGSALVRCPAMVQSNLIKGVESSTNMATLGSWFGDEGWREPCRLDGPSAPNPTPRLSAAVLSAQAFLLTQVLPPP